MDSGQRLHPPRLRRDVQAVHPAKGPAKPRWQRAEPTANGRNERTGVQQPLPPSTSTTGCHWPNGGMGAYSCTAAPFTTRVDLGIDADPVPNPILLKMVENFGFSTESKFFFNGDDRCFQINTSALL